MKKTPVCLTFVAFIFLLITGTSVKGYASTNFGDQPFMKPYPGLAELPLYPGGPDKTTSSSVQPSAPMGTWAYLVFQDLRWGNWEILFSNDLGQHSWDLAGHERTDRQPRLNRDLQRVVFTTDRNGNYEIYVVNIDDTGLTRLTGTSYDEAYPAWSPDGNRIVYMANKDENWEIYTMEANGQNQQALTVESQVDQAMPAWSPDGGHIVWVRYGDYGGELWIMDADGSNQTAITGFLPYLQHPVWSPDGSLIAFDADLDGDGWNELATVQPDGQDMAIVFNPGNYDYMADMWMGSWHPSGRGLLFTRVEYILYEGQLYINYSYIEQYLFSLGDAVRLIGADYPFYPDLQSADLLPPVVEMKPLPAYQPASGFEIHWQEEDPGPADINLQELQYRQSAGGEWADVEDFYSANATYWFAGHAGETLDFRVRASDEAGNEGLWAANPSQTTIYQWILSGRLLDNRAHPIMGTALTIDPPALNSANTGAQAQYKAYLSGSGSYTFQAAAPGYFGETTSGLDIAGDTHFDLYLKPETDYMSNGSFEADSDQLSGWAITGTLPVEIVPSSRTSGLYAALLGRDCPTNPCLNSPRFESIGFLQAPSIATDNQGLLHMLDGAVLGDRMVYHYRTDSGIWSEPVEIPGSFDTKEVYDQSILRIGPLGALYAVWSYGHSGGAGLFFSQRLPGENWTNAVRLADATIVGFETGEQGELYIAYEQFPIYGVIEGGIYLLERTAGGEWLEPVTVGSSNISYYAFERTSDGSLYLVGFGDLYLERQYFYRRRTPDGAWLDPVLLGNLGRDRPALAADYDGRLHLVVNDQYVRREADGSWSAIETLDVEDPAMDVDINGNLHVVGNMGSTMAYQTWNPLRGWSPVGQISDTIYEELLSVGPNGQVHMLYGPEWWSGPPRDSTTDWGWFYRSNLKSVVEGQSVISQTISLPADLNRPTLSLHYRLDAASAWTDSGMQITATTGSGAQTIYTATQETDWTYAWIDLSPWAGQTITLSLGLWQYGVDPHVALRLDDLTLGEWSTPLIYNITTQSLPAATPFTMTISGENFIPTPDVRIDSLHANSVIWVDEHTLLAEFAEGVSAGQFTVWVTNPGGPSAGWQVWIGEHIHLPVLIR